VVAPECNPGATASAYSLHPMQPLEEIALVAAPLECDREVRRWYADGGTACLALSADGKLLEPLPTFGPSCYLLIAIAVELREANEYAYAHGYYHARNLN
jgi:hypothetical protein